MADKPEEWEYHEVPEGASPDSLPPGGRWEYLETVQFGAMRVSRWRRKRQPQHPEHP